MWLLRSRFLTLPAALCCLVFAGSSHLLAQTSPPLPVEGIGLFRIAGIITSASEGHPLSHARVSLQNVKNFHDQIFMITGDDGHFEFANLHAGKYSLVGGKRGYISAAYDEHEQFSTAIVTGAGVDTENLTLRLVPTAAITGHVFDESGEPVRSAAVKLWRDGGLRVIPGHYLARDGADGRNPGQGYIRVALVQDKEITAEALHRIVAVLG